MLYNEFKEWLALIIRVGLSDMGDIFQVEGFHREDEVNMRLVHEQDQVESFRVDSRQIAKVRVSCPRSAWAGSWGTVSRPKSEMRFDICSKGVAFQEKNDISRYGWEGSLSAVHVDVPFSTVQLHVETAAVARTVNLELELLTLVSVGMEPLWEENKFEYEDWF